jgi:trehalose 2-sulfotransferase
VNQRSPLSRAPRIMDVVPLPPRSLNPGLEGEASPVNTRVSSYEPRTSCFIATLPRSGSWLLSELLSNTGLAGEANEYFRPDFTALWASEWALPHSYGYREYVSAAKRITATSNDVFSAKLHWYQFVWLCRQLDPQSNLQQESSTTDMLNDWFPNLKYVFLWRRNTARQAISYYRAAVTQEWFLTHKPLQQTLTEAIDYQQIRWFEDVLLEQKENWQTYFGRNRITPLEVVYEDFVTSYEATVRRILYYLGVVGKDVATGMPTLRRQSDGLSEWILRRYLAVRDSLLQKPPDLLWSMEARRFRSASLHEQGSLLGSEGASS